MLDLFCARPLLLAIVFICFPIVYLTLSVFFESRAIARQGARASNVKPYLPFSIDVIIRSLAFSSSQRDLLFWDWLFSWSPQKQNRTVEATLARQRFIFTADPENIRAILATQFADYGKGEPFHEEWRDFLGNSIFTTDGEQWRASRQLIRPQFVKDRVADLDIFEKHVVQLLTKIPTDGEEVDISALLYRFALDSATDYLLGESVGSLENPQVQFAEAFEHVQKVQSLLSRAGPLNKYIPRGAFWKHLKVINNFVEPFIESVLRMNILDLKERTNRSFLHALAASGTRDRKVIRDQVVAILLAGRDTTAGALSFAFQELSNNPEIWKKLRQEVMDHVGPSKAPTYENLKNMQYCSRIISETLRLYPSVPFNVRLALRDTYLPTGGGKTGLEPIGILKNTPIAYSTMYMQRREDLFPGDSLEFPHVLTFAPERWATWTPKPWTYIPFNGGPRICIGQQFALTEMAYVMARFIQRFERITRYWKDEDLGIKSEVVICPKNGVKIGFWEAKGL